MFIKVSSSGGHLYARLVESFRNENGQPRQRTVATLGRIDEQGGPLDALLAGLGVQASRAIADAILDCFVHNGYQLEPGPIPAKAEGDGAQLAAADRAAPRKEDQRREQRNDRR